MEHDRVVGLKDSSGNLDYIRDVAGLKSSRQEWSVFVGPQELLVEAMQIGADGGVLGGANMFPELYVALFEAIRENSVARIDELNRVVRAVPDALFRVGQHPSSLIKGVKCALSCMGICDDFMAEPFHRFRSDERARIQQNLEQLSAQLEGLGVACAS